MICWSCASFPECKKRREKQCKDYHRAAMIPLTFSSEVNGDKQKEQ